MSAYRIFTISSGLVSEGVQVGKLTLKGAGTEIPAILIGEEGRGRELGVLPVQLTNGQYREWKEKGRVTIQFAEVGTSKSGKPKLFAKDGANSDEKFIAVFRTKTGFRGSNAHTGDRTGEMETDRWDNTPRPVFHPFPGEILISGRIAEGAAGRAGSGEQYIAVMPKGVWFRTAYGGRLYGSPGSHYYRFDGAKIVSLTWDEREALAAVDDDYAVQTSEQPAELDEESDEDELTVQISVKLLKRLIAMAHDSDPEVIAEAESLLK